ncbi:preprotein translocase subunit SecG [Marinobacterium arenosum]|uniref:preprotein translocase subunit SecG n=1 Tax=Marinobacterium arenosum TaxID=2862496 RepID=UPI001C971384|nr:preprotein translocase subunit SecG [Marinobacterium arenosum]MBY4678805.1 preprotein translocase subunit SecG [Marinobacterium arenosum]
METAVLIAHVLLAAGIIGFVLLQQGKGAEAGASFGGGASQTVFGASGSTSFLARVTGVLAAGLFVTSFVLAVYAKQKAETISDAGIPAAEVIEVQQEAKEAELPALEESTPAQPADADVPTAD